MSSALIIGIGACCAVIVVLLALVFGWRDHHAAAKTPETQDDFTASIARWGALRDGRDAK